MVRLLRHRQTKGAATDRLYLRPPRHISTLPIVDEMRLCARGVSLKSGRSRFSVNTTFARLRDAMAIPTRSVAVTSQIAHRHYPAPCIYPLDSGHRREGRGQYGGQWCRRSRSGHPPSIHPRDGDSIDNASSTGRRRVVLVCLWLFQCH